MSVEGSAHDSRTYGAWTGTIGRLRTIVGIIEAVVAPLREADLATVQPPSGVELQDYEVQSLRRKRERLEDWWTVKATATEKRLSYTRSGAALAVLDEIEDASITHLEIELEPLAGPHAIRLGFDRQLGVKLMVRGPNPKWVQQTLVVIDEEVRTSVPRWQKLRTPRAAALMVGSVFALGIVSFIRRIGFGDNHQPNLLIAMFVSVALGIATGLVMADGFQGLIPGFELLSPGERSSGTRAIKWILGVGGAIVLGIAANLLTPIFQR